MKKLLLAAIGFLIIVIIVLQAIGVYISNTNSLDSIKATKLTAQIENLQEENMQLEAQVLSYSSYNEVSSRAADLGYDTTRDIISVYDPVKVAINQ